MEYIYLLNKTKRFVLSLSLLFFIGPLNDLNAQCTGADFSVSSTKCANQSISFTNTSTTVADGSTYEWDFKDGSPKATTPDVNHIFSSAGTYAVTLTRTCPNTQKDIKTISVIVAAKPSANDFTFSPSAQCSENAISFFTTTPTAGMLYSWNFADALSSSNTSKSRDTVHIFEAYGTANQSYNVVLTTTDNKGCFASTTKAVTVKQRPDLQVSEENNFKTCIGNVASGVNASVKIFNDTQDPSKSSITGYKINWGDGTAIENKANATFDNLSGITHGYSALNQYNISIEATASNGCKTTKTYRYLVDANPGALLTPPPVGTNTGCGPLTVVFTNNSTNVSNTTRFYFTPGDGSPRIQLPTGVTNNTITYTYKSSCINGVLQSLEAKLDAVNECDSTASKWNPIRVYPQPIAEFTANAPFCKGNTITFTNNSTPNRCAANPATRYIWDWGDSTAIQVFNNVAATLAPQQTLTHTYADTGTYKVILRAENNSNNGCGFTTDTLLIRVSDKPTADFSFSNNLLTGCAPFQTTLSNMSQGIGIASNWSVSPASGFTFTNGTSNISANPQLNFTAAGSYDITLVTTTPCGTSSKTTTIVVKDKPSIIFPVAPPAQCAPATFIQTSYLPTINANGGTLGNQVWNFAGGIASNGNNTATPGDVTFNTPQNYTISLTASNECGNTTTQSPNNFFTVGTPPVAVAGKDTSVCSGNTAQLGAASLVNHTYSWSPATGLNNPFVANPTATLTNTTGSPVANIFTLSVTANGCTSTKNVTVTVNPFPTVSAGSDTSLCKADLSFQLHGTPSGGTWSGGAFVTATGLFSTTGLSAGTYTALYTFSDAATKCQAIQSKTVTIHALPNVDAGGPFGYCNTDSIETLSGYSPLGGSWSGVGVTATGDFTPSVVGVKTGHKLFYTFTDVNTCTAKDSTVVNISVPTSVNMGMSEDICTNAGIVTLKSPTPAGGTWKTTPYLSATGAFDPQVAGVSNFTATYITSGTSSCQASGTRNIFVLDTTAVDAGPDEIVCANQNAFVLTGFSPNGGVWVSSPNAYVAGNNFDPTKAGTITSDVVVHLAYTFENANTGCISKDVKTITIKPVPKVDLIAVPTEFCTKDTLLDLSAMPTGGTWTGNGFTGNLFNPKSAGVGTHTLNYKIVTGTCSDDKDISITIAPLSKPLAGVDLEICVDATTKTLTGFSPAGGVWVGKGISGNTFNPSIALEGNHSLVYSTGANTCKASDTLIAKVNPIPTINVGTNPQGVCEGAPAFNLTGWSPNTGGTWAWTGTGITDATLGTFDPSTSGAGSFTLTFAFTDATTGCDDTKAKTINVNALPLLSFTAIDSICTQKNFAIANSSTGTNLNNTWSLASSSGFTFISGTNANSINPILSFTKADVYQIKLIGQTGAGCIDSLKKQVTVLDPPVAKFAKDRNDGCGPLTINFTNQTTGVLKAYFWDFGNGQTSNAQNPAPIVFEPSTTQDTVYYVSLRVSSPTCDDVVYRDSVKVFPKPYVVFGPDKNVGCSPVEIKFKNNTTGRPEAFFWDYGDGKPTSTTAVGLHSHFFQYLGTKDTIYTVTLIATNTCGKDTGTTDIKVLPNTVKAFFNTDVFEGCEPLRVNFTNFSTGGSNIKWDLGDGNVTNTVSPSHTYTQAGEYFVTLFVNNGCSFDTTKPAVKIKVNPKPQVKFSILRNIICETNTAHFIDHSSDLKKYSWQFGDGDSSQLSNPKHVYNTASVYKVILTGQSATTNCIARDSANIDVKPGPDAQFTTDATVGCQPFKVNFKNTSTNSVHYNWLFGEGNTTGRTDSSFVFAFDTAGTFNIKLYSFNALGCVDSISRSITVNPKPDSKFSIDPKNACKYPVRVQTSNASKGFVNAEWNFGNTRTSILDNPFTFFDSVGTYNIRLICTSDKGCKDTSSTVFHAYPMPTPSFTATPLSGCEPLAVSFTSNTQFASQYIWDFGDGSTRSKLENPVHLYDKEGIYTVKLIATGNGVCSDSVTRKDYIETLKQPDVAFSYENVNNPVPHGEIQFSNLTSDAISYVWDFGDGDTSNQKDPVHRYESYGNVTVKLIAKNALGCSDTSSTLILVDFYKGLWVPTALTPDNGSPETRLFFPKGKGLAKYSLEIYDNWGILIWKSEKLENGSPAEGWDGIGQNGKPVPPDVYVWKVSAEFLDGTLWEGQNLGGGKNIKTVGTVTLLR